MISVSALIAAGQRLVVGVADEPDFHALFVLQVAERLPDLSGEVLGYRTGLALVPQWRNEVSDARTRRLAFHEAHLAEFFDPANLNTLNVAIEGIGRIRI